MIGSTYDWMEYIPAGLAIVAVIVLSILAYFDAFGFGYYDDKDDK